MSRSKQILAAAVLAASTFVGAAKAATVTVTPVVTRYYANQAALDGGTPAATIPAGNSAAGIYEVAFAVGVQLSAADTTAGFTGLGNLFFDLNQGASSLPAHLTTTTFGSQPLALSVNTNSVSNPTRFTYTDPVTGSNVTNGAGGAATTALFGTFDNGTQDDLKALSVELNTGVYGANDPRLNLFQAAQNATLTNDGPSGAFTLGNPLKTFEMMINYDGAVTNPKVTLQPFAAAVTEGFGLHNNTTGLTTFFGTGTAGQSLVLSPITFGTVPEPTSLSLLALGSLAGLRRRRA